MSENVVHIGIDLGTFKTSIVSSNGRRDVMPTAVGWPRDHVAQAMLGREIVFGDEIWEQRLALDIVRPFKKGVLKYNELSEVGDPADDEIRLMQAAQLLVEHAVSSINPPSGAALYGVIGAPSRASVANKQVLLQAARGTLDAVFIVAEPFAIAFGMNRLNGTLVVDIGAGTIDICPVYGTYPAEEDQLTLPLGGDAIDEEFCRLLGEEYPQVRLSMNMAREIKEKYGFVHEVNTNAIVTLPFDGQPREIDLTEPLKEACQTIVQPIVSGIRQVLEGFDPEFQQTMRQNILLGGGGSQLKGLDQIIEQSLSVYGGGNVTRVYDSMFAGAVGALKMAMDMPHDYWTSMEQIETTSSKSAA